MGKNCFVHKNIANEMFEKPDDAYILALIFIPDWFATPKMHAYINIDDDNNDFYDDYDDDDDDYKCYNNCDIASFLHGAKNTYNIKNAKVR